MNKKQRIKNKKLIVLAGPTASGKTDLAKKLIKKFNGEVISADSRQVYIGLDIGTNKDKSFPQHLIDILTPNKQFTVFDFQKRATKIIEDIQRRGKIPFIVGGSGLYIDALVYNFNLPPRTRNPKLRTKLDQKTKEELFGELQKLDPKTAKIIDKNNKRRLIRALEVGITTGKPFSSFQKTSSCRKEIKYDVLYLGVNLPRTKLYQKIDQRVDEMIKKGLIRETKNLYKNLYSKLYSSPQKQFDGTVHRTKASALYTDLYTNKKIWNLPALSGIGYQEIGQYLQGKITLEKAISKIKYNTHSLARRQLTWFRKNKDIKWISFDPTQDKPNQKEAEKLIKEFLEK